MRGRDNLLQVFSCCAWIFSGFSRKHGLPTTFGGHTFIMKILGTVLLTLVSNSIIAPAGTLFGARRAADAMDTRAFAVFALLPPFLGPETAGGAGAIARQDALLGAGACNASHPWDGICTVQTPRGTCIDTHLHHCRIRLPDARGIHPHLPLTALSKTAVDGAAAAISTVPPQPGHLFRVPSAQSAGFMRLAKNDTASACPRQPRVHFYSFTLHHDLRAFWAAR